MGIKFGWFPCQKLFREFREFLRNQWRTVKTSLFTVNYRYCEWPTTYHYHNDFKFYLQLNVYASLSREWIDLAWLNVMVCVWRSTKTSKIEKILGFDPTCFQTSSGADERIDIGCWEVPRCHTIPREISAYSDDGRLVRPSLFTLKMSRCRGRVTFKVTQIHSYAFWDYHWPKY